MSNTQEFLFCLYYLFLLVGITIGIIRHKMLDSAMRVLVILLTSIALFEFITFYLYKVENYASRPLVYHFSCVLRIILVSIYFIKLIKPLQPNLLMLINLIIWPILGILNVIFFQPLNTLNTNMVMLECFTTITLSLYFIYWAFKKDTIDSIFFNPHFWIAVLFLLLCSSTFFFWAFIRILYSDHWKSVEVVMILQVLINLIVYAGIAAVLFFYPKKADTLDYT